MNIKEALNGQTSIFVKRRRTFTLVFLCVATVFVISSSTVNFDTSGGLAAIPRAAVWIANNLVPTEASFRRLPTILNRLQETILVSVAVTVCATIVAFFVSLLGTKALKVNPWIQKTVRMVAAIFRNIPDVVWAMILIFSFGQNILTGFFALFFATFGMLTRIFIETIDEVSAACVEALHATGANNMQIVFQGIIPSSVAEIVSWVLYMIETNIRSSTVIGVLTGTGIGALFNLYYSRFDFGAASLVVISLIVSVVAIETISNQIRKVIIQ
jgi:phosphonate transport system permease protein